MRKFSSLLMSVALLATMTAIIAVPYAGADTGVTINEFLADPAADLPGDANGDGIRDSGDDEFVEITNDSGSPLVIDGWTISDFVGVRHTFPSGTTVPDGCSVVVFGGNTPTGVFGNAVVQIASTGALGLNNTGDTITLNDGSSDIASTSYGSEGGDNQSLTLDPDVTGGTFVKHSVATGSGGALFSPGTKIDGSSFDGCSAPPTGGDPVVNEFVANHTGDDTHEFIEVLGDPNTLYSAFTVLEIEGDSSGSGTIDGAWNIATTDGSGYWTTGFLDGQIENGTMSLLLVEDFTGSTGDDIDDANDGVIDNPLWNRIVDDVAVWDGGSSDHTYASTVLGDNYDGLSPYHPGGASRIPNGIDTDTAADWMRNDFDGEGLPGFDSGTPAFGEALNTPAAVNEAVTVPADPFGMCLDGKELRIHEIQGSGTSSPYTGSIRVVEGIVVGDFTNTSNELGAFFLQEEDSDADTDPTTSEGLYVANNGFGIVNVGDTVRVRGFIAENYGQTEMQNVTDLEVCAATSPATPATVTLPVGSVGDWEYVEGMLVNLPQTLYASGNYNQGRYGEVDLSVGGPLDNPTNVVSPGAAANVLQDLNDRSRIQLDDGSNVQNPEPLPPYIGDGSTLRTGDTIPELAGVVGYAFGSYEIHPTTTVTFTRVNDRPATPSAIDGRLKVASFNVLNYFTTIDTGAEICGPSGDQECRGADSELEFQRQRDKIIDAIIAMDADVIGLMEIENPTDVPLSDLVDGLNDIAGKNTYREISTGAIGDDAIAVAFIYKKASVTAVARPAILDSSVDPTYNDAKNRPALAQTFLEKGTGSKFTVVVNHFKSKGSDCDSIGDPDTGDGQGNCNVTRTDAAVALANWLASDPTGSNDPDFLVIGDLNSYALEDPIEALKADGFTDLVKTYVGSGWGEGAYSYNYQSQSGYLDHALANGELVSQIVGATVWHINADEPSALNYNTYNQAALYQPDQYRASDHDAVIVGLDLYTSPPKPHKKRN